METRPTKATGPTPTPASDNPVKAATAAAADAVQDTPAAPVGDPRGAALAAAARADELRQLRAERDKLVERLEADPDELVVLRAVVNALRSAVARSGRVGASGFAMSEGTRAQLLQTGRATDERTGDALIHDGGKITRIDARGKKTTEDMPEPAPAITD